MAVSSGRLLVSNTRRGKEIGRVVEEFFEPLHCFLWLGYKPGVVVVDICRAVDCGYRQLMWL